MTLFHSTSLKIYLVNTSLHNENLPAEYKIQVSMTIGGVTETFDSPTVISSNLSRLFDYAGSDTEGFDRTGKINYEQVTQVDGDFSAPVSSFDVDSTSRLHATAQSLYIRDGFDFTSIGRVNGISSNTVTLNAAYSGALSNNTDIFLEATREPAYVNSFYHIAVTYSKTKNTITLFCNNRQVFQEKQLR